MAQAKITQSFVNNVSKPGIYRDTLFAGFQLYVSKTGVKSYRVSYTNDGKRTLHTIGSAHEYTTDKARVAAINTKTGPAMPFEYSFDRIRCSYLRGKLGRVKGQTYEAAKRYSGNAVAAIGDKNICDVTQGDVLEVYNAHYRDRPVAGNRFLSTMGGIFNHAQNVVGVNLIRNPMAGIKQLPEEARTRVLSDDEWERLWNAAGLREHPMDTFIVRFLMLTGLRQAEIYTMAWGDIDVEGRILRLPFTKSGNLQSIPLSDPALAELAKIKFLKGTNNGKHVVNYGDMSILAGDIYSIQRIYSVVIDVIKDAGLRGVQGHDIRRTFGLKVSRKHGLHIAQKLLRHRDIKTTERIYAPLDHNTLVNAVNDMD